jgi:hypothetical protein
LYYDGYSNFPFDTSSDDNQPSPMPGALPGGSGSANGTQEVQGMIEKEDIFNYPRPQAKMFIPALIPLLALVLRLIRRH